MRFGHCTCMAGLGEVCSHVGAILYTLLAAVNKLSGTACTDGACVWNEPSMGVVRKVGYAPGSQIAFTKSQRKRFVNGCGVLPPAKFPPSTPDECASFYKMLHLSEDTEYQPVKSSILSVVSSHSKRAVQLNIPAPLSKLYKPKYRSLSHQELQAKSEEDFYRVKDNSKTGQTVNMIEDMNVRNITSTSVERLSIKSVYIFQYIF